MKPEHFRAAAYLIWGDHERSGIEGAAEHLEMSVRNAYRLASGQKEIGPDFEEAILKALWEALSGLRTAGPAIQVTRAVLGLQGLL